MKWLQRQIDLAPRARGFHLVTAEILRALPELAGFRVGVAHLFLLHTSASLCVNENADPDVRGDLERHFNLLAPESAPHYEHTVEGPDDMPAHIKAALIGTGISIPITGGAFNLGTWQGIFLCEHRDRAGSRSLVVTIQGEDG
ncbi:MAG: secondary thiamine-phosphate synthase enzyme YjbQ [Candidatus Krumholzibacteria bacterium]|nr:secondary thiamine-phosphate synthase enzyme YjbQ [Candidatus Krumholzibacteria bacterium]MDH4335993.1 secondary thiamine-phosphate synthase enzyme YjbQ [Candidatus Krumholzibacteria bacterium]MDH5268431.1 secondary thiamine-phosphate synthase enzyme YjbQ [Candidatus Krumholzibacteria bacterium]MDH5626938.1 secondary thiamine-phosphate synthase enzyme YjbQ [Candidatus Krumholzibacteria bacterium]